MKTLSLIACLLALILLLPNQPAQAQVAPGEVTGTVQNAAGATLPNQSITLENVTSGQRFATTSDADGVYRVQAVPPGTYRVMVNTPSGMTAPTQNFNVESGMVNTVNLTVSGLPGAQGRAAAPSGVIVTAQPVSITTETASIDNTFNRLYSIRMPQPNIMSAGARYFGAYNLTTLSQGVTAGGLAFSTASGPDVTGIDPSFNTWRIGGIDNSNKIEFGAPALYVSPEATNEVSLFQGQFTPIIGHAIGGKTPLIPLSGSNGVHGSLYDFLQNQMLNARDPLLHAVPQSARYDQNRLGGTIGAPIVRDKVFFSANFEYIPFGFERLAVPFLTAPTPAGFAALSGNPAVDQTKLGILNSLVGSNVGPATSTQTIGGTSVPIGSIDGLAHGWQNSYMGMGNVDFHMSDKDTWHARFVDNKMTADPVATGLLPGGPNSDRNAFMASISGDHVFSSNTVNELRLGYNRWDQSLNPASTLSYLGFPSLFFSDGQTWFTGTQGFNNTAGQINTYNLSDTMSYTRGANTFRLGFDGIRTIGNQASPNLFTNPFAFTSLNNFLTTSPATSAIGLGSFGSPGYAGNQWLLQGWIQDRWNMRPTFQISVGVRYNYSTVPHQLSGDNLTAFLGVPGTTFTTPYPDTANFTPYFGFAWSPNRTLANRNFVIRGSYSMYYAGLYGSALFKNGFPSQQISQLVQFNSANPGVINPFSATSPLSPATVTSITGKQVLPYTMNWNISPQIGLWRNGVLQLQYLGTRTVHLPVMNLLNTPAAVNALASMPIFGGPTPGSGGTLPGLTPFTAPTSFPALNTTTPLATFVPDGNAWYNAGTATFTQRFSHGFQALAAYTYGHQINDSEGSILDLASATRIKHSALWDRRQRFTFSGVMDLAPLASGASSIVRDVLANFSLSGTYTFQSAQVLPVATLMPSGLVSGVAFNNAAGVFVPASAGTGSLLNPYQALFKLDKTNNFNMSATKGFTFTRFTLEARGDAYNLFNHGQTTGAPINTLAHGNFDTIGFGGFTDPFSSSFSNPSLLSTNPRMLTVALRLIF